MARIFFDTNLFIYLVEDEGPLGQRVGELIERLSERGDVVVTSALTLGELLVKPLQQNDADLLAIYDKTLSGAEITLVPFDSAAARIFAALRRDRGIKIADGIQLACASVAKCDLFITNDDRLSKKNVPGVQFITSLDRVPL